jgi:hypothetical protein
VIAALRHWRDQRPGVRDGIVDRSLIRRAIAGENATRDVHLAIDEGAGGRAGGERHHGAEGPGIGRWVEDLDFAFGGVPEATEEVELAVDDFSRVVIPLERTLGERIEPRQGCGIERERFRAALPDDVDDAADRPSGDFAEGDRHRTGGLPGAGALAGL